MGDSAAAPVNGWRKGGGILYAKCNNRTRANGGIATSSCLQANKGNGICRYNQISKAASGHTRLRTVGSAIRAISRPQTINIFTVYATGIHQRNVSRNRICFYPQHPATTPTTGAHAKCIGAGASAVIQQATITAYSINAYIAAKIIYE